jgi:hypothetical protein
MVPLHPTADCSFGFPLLLSVPCHFSFFYSSKHYMFLLISFSPTNIIMMAIVVIMRIHLKAK